MKMESYSWGLDTMQMNLLCKKFTLAKSNEVETRWSDSQEWTNLAGSSKEGYGSERAVLPVMIMIVNKELEGMQKEVVMM
jgi:hypothetical protein